jgi:hypothetical protein
MKATRLAIASVLWALTVCAASAQPVPPEAVRPDISASVGWLNVNKGELDSYNDWYNRAVQGAVTFGWHWSVHAKTEIEASASSRAEFYAATEEIINGLRAHVASERSFRTRRVTVGQQYQFGENAWFHPHLAAGVDFNWETTTRTDREVYLYDPTGRQTTVVRRPEVHPQRTDLHARPFAAAGFKTYMTPRAFFRSDLRVVVGRRVEEALLRIGLGVDF